MKSTITTIALTVLTAAGVSACTSAPAPVVTVEPAPTVTVTSAPEPAPEPVEEDHSAAYLMLEAAWEAQSKVDRKDMCAAYNIAPSIMWDGFKDGADDDFLTKREFYDFMDDHC